MRRLWITLLVLGGLGLGARPAVAQTGQRFALLVEGAAGDQAHADLQRKLLGQLTQRFRDDYKLDREHLTVLASTPVAGVCLFANPSAVSPINSTLLRPHATRYRKMSSAVHGMERKL